MVERYKEVSEKLSSINLNNDRAMLKIVIGNYSLFLTNSELRILKQNQMWPRNNALTKIKKLDSF